MKFILSLFIFLPLTLFAFSGPAHQDLMDKIEKAKEILDSRK